MLSARSRQSCAHSEGLPNKCTDPYFSHFMGRWGKLLKELICSHVNYTFCGQAEEHTTKSYLQLHLWGSLIYCVEQVMACWKGPKSSDSWTMGRGGHGQALTLPGHSAWPLAEAIKAAELYLKGGNAASVPSFLV